MGPLLQPHAAKQNILRHGACPAEIDSVRSAESAPLSRQEAFASGASVGSAGHWVDCIGCKREIGQTTNRLHQVQAHHRPVTEPRAGDASRPSGSNWNHCPRCKRTLSRICHKIGRIGTFAAGSTALMRSGNRGEGSARQAASSSDRQTDSPRLCRARHRPGGPDHGHQ